MLKLLLCGAVERFRLYSFCPSSLDYDTPIKDFVFPTTVPCRLIVRFHHLCGRFLCVGCVSLHHFAAPISSVQNASISAAFWRNRFLTVLVHVVDLVIGPTVHWYTVLLVGLSHMTSFCSLRRPISALISASSLSGSPLWALTFTNKVAAPA